VAPHPLGGPKSNPGWWFGFARRTAHPMMHVCALFVPVWRSRRDGCQSAAMAGSMPGWAPVVSRAPATVIGCAPDRVGSGGSDDGASVSPGAARATAEARVAPRPTCRQWSRAARDATCNRVQGCHVWSRTGGGETYAASEERRGGLVAKVGWRIVSDRCNSYG
jgi:hypothetical protein